MTSRSTHDPDWASKITAEEFFDQQRFNFAAGLLHESNRAILDKHEPGWYDVWLHAEPLSDEGFSRRNAIAAGVLPENIRMYNHPNDTSVKLGMLGGPQDGRTAERQNDDRTPDRVGRRHASGPSRRRRHTVTTADIYG